MDKTELNDAICSLDKVETITKVLNQTIIDDCDFNSADTKNLCSVLLREISYVKSKLSNM